MKDKIQEKKLLYKIVVHKDAEAFGSLYDVYVERIYRFVFYKVGTREDTEDLVSDIFLKTWNYLVSNKNTEVRSFSGLVYKVARNAVIDLYRKRANSKEHPIEHALGVEDSQFEKNEQKQEVAEILVLVRRLKSDYQEIILLRFVEELSIKEIAKILDKSSTSVRVTLHRALKKLKELSS